MSAAAGWEFEDLGRRHHVGGGSHGSLLAGDSIIPIVAAGFDEEVPLPFEVEAPASMRARVPSSV